MLKRYKYVVEDLPSTSNWVAENFVLGRLIGSGTFGKVYSVQSRKDKSVYALKEIMQTTWAKYLAQELKIMDKFGGKNNVMGMLAGHRDGGRVFVVMEYFPHDDFKTLLPLMSPQERLFYFKNLLIALEHLHRNNIIHRDVKPANFLYSRCYRKFSLIDFGLSQEYKPKKPTNQKRRLVYRSIDQAPPVKIKNTYICGCTESVRCAQCKEKPEKRVNKAGTPGFRPPEVVLRFSEEAQTTAIDIWAAGIVLLSLVFQRHPIFRPKDDLHSICQFACIIGSRGITKAAEKNGVLIRIPRFPGVDIGKLMPIVRPGWPKNFRAEEIAARNCKNCRQLIFGNTKGRCFCRKSSEQTNKSLNPIDRLLVRFVTEAMNPDPTTRRTASSLLVLLNDFEYLNPGCYDHLF